MINRPGDAKDSIACAPYNPGTMTGNATPGRWRFLFGRRGIAVDANAGRAGGTRVCLRRGSESPDRFAAGLSRDAGCRHRWPSGRVPGWRAWLAGLASLLLAGCAAGPGRPAATEPPPASAPLAADARWHTFCFRMPFDPAGRPVWARDLLLADRVVAPALAAAQGRIPLWRFHRRAVADRAGHVFSLLVYMRDPDYAALSAALEASPVLARLRAAGDVTAASPACRPEQSRAAIEATSDPSWEPALQRAWPHFIMGVSQSWLALVQAFAAEIPPEAPDPVAAYAEVDGRIAALWGRQGQHAFLHHLSGVYGYQPLRVEHWLRF